MKVNVSVFEKSLVSIIIFVFCVIVLIQIFINNNVLDTIRANENGTQVTFTNSLTRVEDGVITMGAINNQGVSLLINGEEINNENGIISIQVYNEDIVEVKNTSDEVVEIYITNITEGVVSPQISQSYKCSKGISQLFKVKIEKQVE